MLILALTASDVPSVKMENLIKELKSIREIPVRSFGFWKLLVKIYHCLRLGFKHGLTGLLDETFVLGYWKQVSQQQQLAGCKRM